MANTNSLKLVAASSQCATGASWKPTEVSFSCWINPDTIPVANDPNIFTLPSDDVYLRLLANGKLRLGVYTTASAYENYDSASTISLDVWTFVGFSYSSSSKAWAIYVGTSGTADASGTGTNALSWEAPASATTIGANAGASARYWDGLIDDARLYNAAITGATLVAKASQELVGNETNLYDYYRFNGDLNSLVAGGHNLTGVGTPTYSTSVPFSATSGSFLAFM